MGLAMQAVQTIAAVFAAGPQATGYTLPQIAEVLRAAANTLEAAHAGYCAINCPNPEAN